MGKIFFFLYSFLSFLIYGLSLPFVALYSFKIKYKNALPSRFFLRHNQPLAPHGIWFHVCSFGEAKAIAPLVEVLPKEVLRMSATTQTGYAQIKKYTFQSRYLPFEPLLFGWLAPQKALVVMEAELWYLLFVLAKKRGAKTLLINARINDKSFPKYKKLSWFYRQLFRNVDEVYAQTIQDKERLALLGARNIVVTGNIKLAHLPKVSHVLQKPSSLVLCGASTHEGEEGLILDAFVALKKVHPKAVLFLAPRHPERFEKVAKLIDDVGVLNGYIVERYAQTTALVGDIVLLDALGELVNVYAISDVVIMGGAFESIGGHNAAEAAQFGCKIISGKHFFNQKELFDAIEGIVVCEADALRQTVLDYEALPTTCIKYQSNIEPIIKSLKDVLQCSQ